MILELEDERNLSKFLLYVRSVKAQITTNKYQINFKKQPIKPLKSGIRSFYPAWNLD